LSIISKGIITYQQLISCFIDRPFSIHRYLPDPWLYIAIATGAL
jgi:hypothetical protein